MAYMRGNKHSHGSGSRRLNRFSVPRDIYLRVHDFNIHKIGLYCIRHPILGLICLSILISIAIFGSTRVEINRDLAGSWIGESDRLSRFREIDRKLQGSDSNMFVLVGGRDLWTSDGLSALQQLHLDLTLTDGVASALSVFSLPQGDITKDLENFLIPQDISTVADLEELRARVTRHPSGSGYLVSRSAGAEQWFVYLIGLEDVERSDDEEAAIVLEIEALAAAHTRSNGRSFVVGGLPKAKLDVVSAIRNDFLFYGISGLLLGILIAAAYFRSFRYVVIASVCPVFAAVLSFGCMGLLGVKVNPLLSAIPSLVLAVTFTDTMHLMSDLRREIPAGGGVRDALARTFEKVAPACSVAAITTAVAMLSLLFADAEIIRQFGKVAAVGTMIGVLSLMISVPILTRVLLHRGMPGGKRIFAPPKDGWLTAFSARIGGPVMDRRVMLSIFGLAATAVVILGYFQMEPRFRLGDQLPTNSSYRKANEILDQHFDGANPIFIAVDASKSTMTTSELLDVTRRSRQALSERFPDKSIVSIDALRSETGPDAVPSDAEFDRWVLASEEISNSRLFSSDNKLSALAFRTSNAQAASVASVADQVEMAIQPALAGEAGAELEVTGLAVIMAREIPAMIVEMNWGLFGAFFFVFLLLGYLFRSAMVIVLSITPNLLPVFAAGLTIALFEGGISLSCLVGMTVGFGLAVDNASHFLNRLLIESRGKLDMHFIPGTLKHIGPILIATTAVLVCCLAVTSIGQTQTSRIFGFTCIVVLIFALITNLVILPAMTAVFRKQKLI